MKKGNKQKTVKRVFTIMLALLMVTLMAPGALADSEHSNSGKSGQETKNNGKTNQNKTKTEETTEAKEQKQYKGISVDKITLAIDSVTDEATKAELAALLETYMAALDSKDEALSSKTGSMSELSQLASDARAALKDGLEEAGFTLGSVLGWQEWKEWPSETAIDMLSIADAIAALDDTDANKAVLTDLMTAYQEALAAQEAADEENEDAAKEAMQAARDALLEALYEAGLLPIADAVTATPEPSVTPEPTATPEPTPTI